MTAPRPTRRDPEPPRIVQAPRRPARRIHAADRDAIVILALSIAVAVAGGFAKPIDLVIAAAGGITAAVIIHKEHS